MVTRLQRPTSVLFLLCHVSHAEGDPLINLFMMLTMASDLAQTKAIRRRTLREAFPHPLNQVALRHVDAVAALDDAQRLILSKAIQKTELRYAGTLLEALNKDVEHLQNEDALVALIPARLTRKAEVIIERADTTEVNPADIDTLSNLLLK